MDRFAKYEYVHVVHSCLHQNLNTFEEITCIIYAYKLGIYMRSGNYI